MQINIKAVKQLIQERFRNNQSWFAEELSMDAHYFNQIMKETKEATSPKACRGIINYCKKNSLNIHDYIIF